MYNITMNCFYVQYACNSLFEEKNKKNRRMKTDTGPNEQPNKHTQYVRPLSLVHVRRNRQLILLKNNKKHFNSFQ
jgi:hypothetical protein